MKTLRWFFDWGNIWVIDEEFLALHKEKYINSPYSGWLSRDNKEQALKDNFVKKFWWYIGDEIDEERNFNILVCPRTGEYIFPWDKIKVEWEVVRYINNWDNRQSIWEFFYTDYLDGGNNEKIPDFLRESLSIKDSCAHKGDTEFEFIAHYDWHKEEYLPDWESIMYNKKTMEITTEGGPALSREKILEGQIEILEQKKQDLSEMLHHSKEEVEIKKEELKEKEKVIEEIRVEMKWLKEIKEIHKPTGRSSLWENVILSDLNYRKLQLSWQEKIPLLLEWPSGTGKSTIVRTLAEDNKIPFVEFNFNGDTTVEHLLWHKVLVGVKSSKESPMAWEDWPLTDAVRNGKIFLAHELNASSPEIQFILNGLLELKNWELGNLTVQGNNWEVIKAHPNFRFYGTYNRGYLWTKSFGTSIMSRFIWIRIDPLKKEEEASLLNKKYPWNEVAINLLVRLEEVLRGKKDFTYDISTRDIEQALLFTRNWFWYRDSIEATIEQSLQIDLEKKILWEEFERIFTS